MNFYFEFNRVIYRTVYYLYVVLTLKNAIITLERSIDVETTFKSVVSTGCWANNCEDIQICVLILIAGFFYHQGL